MKQDKKEKRNNILYSVLGFVLGIAMCGIGIYGMILNRIESQEYKNTTDKREVIAVVESCREIDNSDDKDKNKKNSRSVKYRTKLAMSGNDRRADGSLIPGDALFVKEMSGISQSLDDMCPYVYENAWSPHLASRVEGNPVSKSVVLSVRFPSFSLSWVIFISIFCFVTCRQNGLLTVY